MEILGVGPLELIFILVIAILVLGPSEMGKAGRTIGRALNRFVKSSSWLTLQHVWRKLRYLPNLLMREANLEAELKSLGQDVVQLREYLQQVQEQLQSEKRTIYGGFLHWITPPSASPSDLPPISESKGLLAWTTPPSYTLKSSPSTTSEAPDHNEDNT